MNSLLTITNVHYCDRMQQYSIKMSEKNKEKFLVQTLYILFYYNLNKTLSLIQFYKIYK